MGEDGLDQEAFGAAESISTTLLDADDKFPAASTVNSR